MTIKLRADELQLISKLDEARILANAIESQAPQQGTYGLVSKALRGALATAYWERNPRQDGNWMRAHAYAENVIEMLVRDGERIEVVTGHERRQFVDRIRDYLTDEELPLRGDEWTDHHKLRDDGSLLVRLFGPMSQEQAMQILESNLNTDTYREVVVERFGGDSITVRPTYGINFFRDRS